MKREKTSQELEEAGYSILLCLCGGRNTRSRFKTQHSPHSSVTLHKWTNLRVSLLAKWESLLLHLTHRALYDQITVYSFRNPEINKYCFGSFICACSKQTYIWNEEKINVYDKHGSVPGELWKVTRSPTPIKSACLEVVAGYTSFFSRSPCDSNIH